MNLSDLISPHLMAVKDQDGNTAMLMNLATIEFERKVYRVMGNIHETPDGIENDLLLVREEEREDGTSLVVVHDEEEVGEVMPRFFSAVMPELESMPGVDIQFGQMGCNRKHGLNEICVCGMPEFLQ